MSRSARVIAVVNVATLVVVVVIGLAFLDLRSRVDAVQEDVSRATAASDLTSLQSSVKDLRSSVDDLNRQVSDLRGQTDYLGEPVTLESIEARLSALASGGLSLTDPSLKSLADDMSDLRSKVDSIDSDLSDVQSIVYDICTSLPDC